MLPSNAQIYVATTPIDMRRSFDGLALAVAERMRREPQSGALFVFTNTSRTRLKVLWFDPSGYTLLYKRLDNGVFRLPDVQDASAGSIDIDARELFAILAGVQLPADRTSARKIVHEARSEVLHARAKMQQTRSP
jgi:transposase